MKEVDVNFILAWFMGTEPILADYTTNLNSMYNVEKRLHPKQWHKYVCVLARVISQEFDPNVKVSVPVNVLISATAYERAEAFLRTINLWKK